MFLESSKDILYLVIAFCIIWVTVFLCWMFYYVTRILRNASQIIEEFRLKLQHLTESINHIRNKVEGLSNLFTLGSSGISGFAKKFATKHANKMVNKGTEAVNKAAKEAVNKAVKSTAKSMKKAAKKIKKKK